MAQFPQCTYAVWPENAPIFLCFLHDQRSLWRHGFDGPVGLDGPSVEGFIARNAPRGARRSAAERRDELRGLLAAMEDGCLAGWGELREQRRREEESRRRR